MALTIGLTGDWMGSAGSKRIVVGTIAFDSSYPTGGESLTAANIGLKKIDFIAIDQGTGGLVFSYDYTNSKVLAYYPTGGGAVPAALAAPAVTVPAGATQVTSTAAQPNLTETAGIGVQVADTTDLATITGVRFFAVGW